MANEITVTTKLACTNGNLQTSNSPAPFTVTQTTLGGAGAVQSIATANTAVVVTNLTNLGWAFFKNMDATNYVQIGPYSGGVFYPLIRLAAGKSCVFPLDPAITLYAKANTAAVKLQYQILEV